MPLDDRYAPADVRKVLGIGMTAMAPRYIPGGAEVPGYYQNDNALILDAATDAVNSHAQMLQTLDVAFDALSQISDTDKQKKIIIPVAEEQKILGLFPRNHWVTVYYDPAKNEATLLDSRPWIASFLYPVSTMQDLLVAGLTKVYGAQIASQTSFEVSYQDVQHNDTFCGAWTCKNIRDLAGANPQNQHNSIDQQLVAYTAEHEENVIKYHQEIVKNPAAHIDVYKINSKLGLWQSFLNFFGLGDVADTNNVSAISIEPVQVPESTNLGRALQQLQSGAPSQEAVDSFQLIMDKPVSANSIRDDMSENMLVAEEEEKAESSLGSYSH